MYNFCSEIQKFIEKQKQESSSWLNKQSSLFLSNELMLQGECPHAWIQPAQN